MKMTEQERYLFHDMQKHPENYSTEQTEAMMDMLDETPNVELAWHRFENKHKGTSLFVRLPWMRQVAVLAVGLLISGVVYAICIATGWLPNIFADNRRQEETTTNTLSPQVSASTAQDEDAGIRTFDNVPLIDILNEMAESYGVEVAFDNHDVQHIRLYYQWDRSTSLDDNIAMLNAFQHIHIELQDNLLTVK